MNKAYLFVLGGTSTFLLSFFLFIVIPRYQVSRIPAAEVAAQRDYTPNELKGRAVYIEYGCLYCHSQQVRDPGYGADQAFGWGPPSRPADYVHDHPPLLGTMRTGPDLSNIGSRQPSRDWQHLHLYNPRIVVPWSIMPGFSFLYKRVHQSAKPAENARPVPGKTDEWIIPSEKAERLVDYLLSLNHERPSQQEPTK
jgi:cytochrome c oxidase cbb3-type subunit 2